MLCDNLKLITILVAAHVLLLLGCADASPSTSKPTSKVATFTSTEMDNLQSSWSPPELDTPRLTPAIHNLGVEFHTRESDIIARAQVVKVETQIHALDRKASEKIRQSFTHIPGEKIYFPAIAFELKVLEWLKGGFVQSFLRGGAYRIVFIHSRKRPNFVRTAPAFQPF